MKKKKRSKARIKQIQAVILKAADKLQESGIDVSHRVIVVGGTRPKSVHRARKERDNVSNG